MGNAHKQKSARSSYSGWTCPLNSWQTRRTSILQPQCYLEKNLSRQQLLEWTRWRLWRRYQNQKRVKKVFPDTTLKTIKLAAGVDTKAVKDDISHNNKGLSHSAQSSSRQTASSQDRNHRCNPWYYSCKLSKSNNKFSPYIRFKGNSAFNREGY